jgi:ABC-2 type transport system ATP-binding protein
VADSVSRYFGPFCALAPTDLTLRAGEIVGLIGPNGSGKSTLLNCLGGLLPPSDGKIHISGYDLYRDEREARRRLSYVPDVPQFYTELTAWEHLRFVALAHDVEESLSAQAPQLLKRLGLDAAADVFPYAFSRGMQLKLSLACALIRPFQVLLLDEPTSALDPDSVASLTQILREAATAGAAILLTTHDVSLAETLCQRVYVMRAGQLTLPNH